MQTTRPIVWPDAGDASPSTLEVTVTAGPDRGRVARFEQARVVVGRGEGADLRLTDPTVSLFHVELQPGAREVGVVDLGSRNGTRAGAVRVERASVPAGAALTVGSTTLTVAVGAKLAVARAPRTEFGALRGMAPPMRELFAALDRIARTELSVLLTGETGTGKELAARAIHAASRRASGPFVVLDCGALPPSLAQSALFGHERGAFTGATERRVGAFESAHGGTLLLDEVGELPAELQAALLGVLERREVTPLGAQKPRAVDVRVLSATWRDLRQGVNAGTFRQDLYYRIAQATARMPSLAERGDDVPFLVMGFLANLPADVPAAREVDEAVLDALVARPWPGNVRELRAVVERLAQLADGPVITADTLAFDRMLSGSREAAPDPPSVPPAPPLPRATSFAAPRAAATGPLEPYKEARQSVLDGFEASYLRALMARAEGNLSRAAALAGLQRHSLRDLLRKHGLHAPPG